MRKQTVKQSPDRLEERDRIRGKRITLRPVTHADTEAIVRWRNDPDVRDRFVFREPVTKQMHEAWLEERVAKGHVVQWMICEPGDGNRPERPVGSVYLRDIDPGNKRAEYGIFIGEKDAKNKGYAKEAAQLVLRFAFEELSLMIVGLRVYADNERAKKGYLAAGFRAVRTLPGVESTDGERADMIWMEATPGM